MTFLLQSRLMIQDMIHLLTPRFSKAVIILWKEIESKAAFMSTKHVRAKLPLTKVCSIRETTLWRASSVDLPFLKPSWLQFRELSMCM